MRTTTGAEDTILASPYRQFHWRVEVKDGSGTWNDLSTLSGYDWQVGAEIHQSVDQRVLQMTVRLWRDDEAGNSLSPLWLATPYIQVGFECKLYAATTAQGVDPVTADWKEMAHCAITEWDAGSNPMTFVALDLIGRRLSKGWVREETEYGGGSQKTTIQAILTDWAGGETLHGSDPAFTINTYRQQKARIIDAIQRIAFLNGYVVEVRWDDTDSRWELTLMQPNRSATVTQWTFGPDDYETVDRLALSEDSIRNSITVWYVNGTTGEREKYETDDPTSIAKYNFEHWMGFEEGTDSSIDTLGEATTLGDAAKSDLKDPLVDQTLKMPFFWPVQLNDYYEFLAAAGLYSSAQDWAVVGYRHVFEGPDAWTYLDTRDVPVGGVAEWLDMASQPAPGRPSAQVFPVLDSSDQLTASVDGSQNMHSIRLLASKTGVPTESQVAGQTAINGQNLTTAEVGNINDVATSLALQWAEGETIYLAWLAYSAADGGGLKSELQSLEWNPSKASQIDYQLMPVQANKTATLEVEVTDPAGLVTGVFFKASQGGQDFDFSDPGDASWTEDPTATADVYSSVDALGTVNIVSKHDTHIMVAIAYDDEGTTRYIVDGWTFDADRTAELRSVGIGFDDDGYLLVSMVGDEDTVGCVAAIGLGADPTAPAEGASTTLTASAAGGATILTVADTTGFVFGNYAVILDGASTELVYIYQVASATELRVRGANQSSTGISNAHDSGVTITELDNTGASTSVAGGVFARSGTVRMQTGTNQAPADSVQPDMGEEVRIRAAGVGPEGLGPVTGIIRRRRGDSATIPPRVIVQATRSGSSVSVSFTIDDPSLAVAANPSYKRRDGDNQTLDASWQTSWTSSTGTAGSATSLARAITVADPYTALVWRVEWTDELGVTQTIGDELDLASVQEVEKVITIPCGAFTPADDTLTFSFLYDATEGLAMYPNVVASSTRYFAPVLVPQGVTLTDMACRFYRNHADSAVGVTLRVDGTAALFVNTNSTAGWHGNSGTLSQTVGAENYFLDMIMDSDGGATSVAIAKVELTYSAPSFKQTY